MILGSIIGCLKMCLVVHGNLNAQGHINQIFAPQVEPSIKQEFPRKQSLYRNLILIRLV